MIFFLNNLFFFMIFFEYLNFCNYLFYLPISLYLFFFIIINFLFNFKIDNYAFIKWDIDIIWSLFLLCIKTPNFFCNYFISIFKKIYLFLIKIKINKILNFFSLFLNLFISSRLNIWRPLFKKSSYFGYFRSNRAKWLK